LRCKAKTKAGTACRARALKNERFCLFHSNSDRAKAIKAKQHHKQPMTIEQHVLLLERQLRRVQRSKDEEFRSSETRKIISLIYEIRGERPPASNDKKTPSFEERVKKAIEFKQ